MNSKFDFADDNHLFSSVGKERPALNVPEASTDS